MKTIKIKNGYEAIVDDADYEWISAYKWHLVSSKAHYAETSIWDKKKKRSKCYKMHRMIAQPPKNRMIDHINGNKLDNRRCNLRFVTNSQNSMNRHVNHSRSGYRGVHWMAERNKWAAQIMRNQKMYYIGLFEDKVEAAKARDIWAIKFHGEYAVLNFPYTDSPSQQ